MREVDFVMAENARVIGKQSLSTSLQGVFIGTQKYFFFIPVNRTEEIRKTRKGKPVVPTFLYKGKPVADALNEITQRQGTRASELETFILKKIKKSIPETICCAIDDIEQFKIYSTWWGSGILINTSNSKTGWEPLVSRFKASKRKIKTFYQGHSKLRS